MNDKNSKDFLLDCYFDLRSCFDNVKQEFVSYKGMLVPFNQNKILYHYCTIDAFYNIIKSNCFWLSCPTYLNDLTEFKYSQKIFFENIAKYKESLVKTKVSKDESCFSNMLNDMLSRFSNYFENREKELDYNNQSFLICFSSEEDSLAMWNSYISNNTGVSIGLDFSKEDYFIELNSADYREKVSPFYQLPKGAFYDIKYFDKPVLENKIGELLENIREVYLLDLMKLKKADKYSIDNFNEYFSSNCYLNFLDLSIYIKDSNFQFEKETRFISSNFEKDDIKFRVKNNFIVPYIEFPKLPGNYMEDKSETERRYSYKIPIVSLTLSPGCSEANLVIHSLKSFLFSKGYDVNKIQFKESEIPFISRC